MVQRYRNIEGTCWAISCPRKATHRLRSRQVGESPEPWVVESDYCFECAKYFAWWLVYAYDSVAVLRLFEIPADWQDPQVCQDCRHYWYAHGPEVPGCAECICTKLPS